MLIRVNIAHELAKHAEACRLKIGRVDGTPCCGTIFACFQSMFASIEMQSGY